jgi:ParB family chromosome partitioning protein
MATSLRNREGFKRGNTFYAPPEELFLVGIDDKKEHFLKDVDKVRHQIDEGMVRNIMYNGVLETVLVMQEGERVVVAAGRRRVIHAREANRRLVAEGLQPIKIEIKVKRGSPAKLYGIFISENEHRQNDSFLGKAKKAEKMRDYNATEDEIAITFGVSAQTINNWKKLLELDERVLKLVEKEHLSPSAALKLHGLAPDEQWKQAEAAVKTAAESGKRPSGTDITRQTKPYKPRAPSVKLITQLMEAPPTGVSDDFLKGLQLGRGMITAADAGVEKVFEKLKAKPKAKKAKPKAKAKPAVAKRRGAA